MERYGEFGNMFEMSNQVRESQEFHLQEKDSEWLKNEIQSFMQKYGVDDWDEAVSMYSTHNVLPEEKVRAALGESLNEQDEDEEEKLDPEDAHSMKDIRDEEEEPISPEEEEMEEEDFIDDDENAIPVPEDKEYLGKSEDTHFYMVPEKNDQGELIDMKVVDQEENQLFSADENDIDPNDISLFLNTVFRDSDLGIAEVDRQIIVKYVLPSAEQEMLQDQEEEEDEMAGEELPDEGPDEEEFEDEEAESPEGDEFEEEEGDEEMAKSKKKAKSELMRPMESKLTEKKIEFDGHQFDVQLVDEGAEATTISVNGREFRYSTEFASLFAEEGKLTESGIEELAKDALSNLSQEEFEQVAETSEVGSEEMEESVNEVATEQFHDAIEGFIRSNPGVNQRRLSKKFGNKTDEALARLVDLGRVRGEDNSYYVTEDKAFKSCVKGGGKVRTVSGDTKQGLKKDEYVKYCFNKGSGKSNRGEVHKKKASESQVTEEYMDEYDALKRYDEFLDEVYDMVELGDLKFSPAQILKELDPTAYRTGFNDWLDSEDINIDEPDEDEPDEDEWDEDEEDDMEASEENEDMKKTDEKHYEGEGEVKHVFLVKYRKDDGEMAEMRVEALDANDARMMIMKREGTKEIVGEPKQIGESKVDEALSRKYYIQFARMLKDMEDRRAAEHMAVEMADMFKADNPRFDSARFMEAAGIDRMAESEAEEEVEEAEEEGADETMEGKDSPGERDGTGPYKNSYRAKSKKGGMRDLVGKNSPNESKVDEKGKRPHNPKAALRNRGKVVFPAGSKDVKDDKDHFPINSHDQAQDALSRMNGYKKSPAWYTGSLESLRKRVISAVKKAYPGMEVKAKASESKEETKVPMKLDEKEDSAFCLAQELLGLNESVDEMDEIKVGSTVHIMSKIGMRVMYESATVAQVTDKGVEITGNKDEVDQEWYSFDTCNIYPV